MSTKPTKCNETDEFMRELHERYGPPAPELVLRAIGTVIQAGNGRFRRVKWESGEVQRFTDHPDLRPFKTGQRFEAMVTRDADTWKFIGMTGVNPLPPLKPIDPELSHLLWNRLTSTSDLPAASWDEID